MTRCAQRVFGVAALLLLPCADALGDDQQPVRPKSKTAAPTRTATPPWMARVFVSANGGWQVSSLDFTDTWKTTEFVEDASWKADYGLKGDLQYDGGVTVRVLKNTGIGASYSEYRNTNGALVTGQVPHPFFFERLRDLSGESVGLKHKQRAVHISASYLLPLSPALDLSVFGGPSMFSVSRSFVKSVTFTQSYPYDSVAFSGTNVETAKESKVGYHIGADLAWFFTRNIGVGGIARFTRARVELGSAGSDVAKMNVGGLQIGAGLRFRFGAARSRGDRRRSTSPRSGYGVETRPSTAAPGASDEKGARAAVVREGGAPVFVGPVVQASPLDVLPSGVRLTVLREEDGWVKVEWNDRRWGRRVGFVQSKKVRLIDAPQ